MSVILSLFIHPFQRNTFLCDLFLVGYSYHHHHHTSEILNPIAFALSQFSTGLLCTVEGNILSSTFLQICIWYDTSAHWKNGFKGHFTILSLCVEENKGNISSTVTIQEPGIRKITGHWTLSGRDFFLIPEKDLIH